ncbi:MAG: hypothetical protein MJ155_02905 [Candidatus Saccharibacteria bacterium]|nr:hypothetical protein [Candidatus Saccharibacteria bacterium]
MTYDKTKGASGYKPPEKYRPKPAGPKPKPEKVPGFTVASFFGLWAIFAVKYVVDFLLLPKLLPDIYPLSVWAIVVWVISTLIFSFVSIEFVSGFSFFYPFANLIYVVLAAIWPFGLYGAEYLPGFLIAALMGLIMYGVQRGILWILIFFDIVRS